jgi:class 3 adenylate cyclase
VYPEIANLSTLVNEMEDKAARQRIVQAVHLYQREIARIADAVGAKRIHFQGARAHLLIYRPIRNAGKLATKAVLLQMIVDRYGVIFNQAFDDLPDTRVRSGSDLGDAIGTRNGTSGDRELLFVGAPANHAAKLLPDGVDRRTTQGVAEELTDDVGEFVEADGTTFKIRRPTVAELEDLLDAHGIEWSVDDAQERLDADLEQFPASKAGLFGTTDRIDFDTLSFTNSKLVEAATVYGDVSGFTKYIDGLASDDDRREALRAFHAIRKEMARVVKDDYRGTRVQFQGDRVQGVFNVPTDDTEGFCSEAVNAAIGLQSSFEQVLKKELPQIASLGFAVGVSQGTTLAARLGERAHRDRVCLGREVLRAERNEEHVDAEEIGISRNVHEHLDDNLATHFEWSDTKQCFVAKGLTHEKVVLAEDAKAYNEGRGAYVSAGATGPVISTRPDAATRQVKPSSSWRR